MTSACWVPCAPEKAALEARKAVVWAEATLDCMNSMLFDVYNAALNAAALKLEANPAALLDGATALEAYTAVL